MNKENQKEKFTHIRVSREVHDLVKSMVWLDDNDTKVSHDVVVRLGVRELEKKRERTKELSTEDKSLLDEARNEVLYWMSQCKEQSKQHKAEIEILETQFIQAMEVNRKEQRAVALVCSILSQTAALNEIICLRNLNWKQADYHKAAQSIIDDQQPFIEQLGKQYAERAIAKVQESGVPNIDEKSTGTLDRMVKMLLNKFGFGKPQKETS